MDGDQASDGAVVSLIVPSCVLWDVQSAWPYLVHRRREGSKKTSKKINEKIQELVEKRKKSEELTF